MKKRGLKTIKIGVLMGGRSSEREISLNSGRAILDCLKSSDYNVVAIDAGEDLCAALKKQRIDIAFIALHGGDGENGAVQGMLEVMEIQYTGSGVLASALAMDKEASKKVFIYHGIPVPPFKIVHRPDFIKKNSGAATTNYAFSAGFPLPWVVKPAAEGSSVGVEIVRERSGFPQALNRAFRCGDKVVVEKYIKGKEIQIGILNDKVLGGVEVRPSGEFYDYNAKYTSGLTEYILPPEIERKTYERAKKAALSAHKALGCGGATRVDLRVDDNGDPFVLEVNTIPGMTETSLLPKIAKHAGLDFHLLLEEILGGIGGA